MALIKCPNCQKDVSSMITHCPFCNADLTNFETSTAHSSKSYYNPNAEVSSTILQSDDTQQKASSDDHHKMNSYENARQKASSKDSQQHVLFYDDSLQKPAANSRQSRSSSSQKVKNDIDDNRKSLSSNAPQTVSAQIKEKHHAVYGRRLLGYRQGNPLYMLISISYHMAACIGILYAFSLFPQYLASGTLVFHLCRTILAAIMLFLPTLVLTENRFRQNISFFGKRKQSAVVARLVILYIPLAVLFLGSWYFCL